MLAKGWFRTSLALLAIFSLSIITNAQTVPKKILLTGKVLDQNRAAIPSADIWISGNGIPSSAAVTDRNGEFSLMLPPGEYQVRAIAEGFAESTQTCAVTAATNSQSL